MYIYMIFINEKTILNINLHNLIDTITRSIGEKPGDGKKSMKFKLFLQKFRP